LAPTPTSQFFAFQYGRKLHFYVITHAPITATTDWKEQNESALLFEITVTLSSARAFSRIS